MVDSAALKNAYLVAGLNDDQIGQIASLASIRNYSSGQSLACIGQPSDEVYVILSGNLRVMSQDGDLLGEVGTNSVVGEIGLVDASPRTANVVSNGPVSAAVLPTDSLRKLMVQNRECGFVMLANISRVMAGRLRQLNARVDELSDLAVEPWGNPVG
jgi:CRP-like cAMP-binding protein